MKKISILLIAFLTMLFSCSSDDDAAEPIVNIPEMPPQYAMTAKINNGTFEANNPFGNNDYSETNIFNYYPISDFVLLQAREGGVFGLREINLWLKRTDIVVGSYIVGQNNFSTPPSHFIKLIDNSNSEAEYTIEGVVVITSVNATTKIVRGTFEFKTIQELNNPTAIDDLVTEGNFYYKYE